MNKNTVMNGYQVNLPYGGTLPYAVSKTYHLYQCRYNLCLVYKHVVDKPRRLYVCHANAEIVG